MSTLLPDDISKGIAAELAKLRHVRPSLVAVQVKYHAMTLFTIKEWPPNRKRRKWARRLYHNLARVRRQLADDRTLAEADELQPTVECIGELVDMARELMDPPNSQP